MWVSGFKQLLQVGYKKNRLNTINIKQQSMTNLFKLNDLILMSYDKRQNKLPLISYLLCEQTTNLKLHLAIISYVKILKAVDQSIDYVTLAP